MSIFAGVVLLVLFVLCLLARKEEVPKECDASAVTRPFYRLGVWLEKKARRERVYKFFFAKNEERLRLLEPAADVSRASGLQFIKKCGFASVLLAAGMLFALVIGLKEKSEGLLAADGSLKRREYGEGHYSVELDAVVGEEKETLTVNVEERSFTEEEIGEMMPAFHEALEKAVLGKNESAEHVSRPLDPVDSVSGYPFFVEWDLGNRDLLKRSGEPKEGIPEEGTPNCISATISYEDFREIYSFYIRVFPPDAEEGSGLKERLAEALAGADEKSRKEEPFFLPGELDGVKITWQERKKSSVSVLILMVLAASAAVWWGRDRDLENRVRERDEQLKADYPEMVSKLSLYIGAGMSTRMAWKKMVTSYRKKGVKRYVYEEMLLAQLRMDSGVSELQAYRLFGTRCRSQKYIKLVSLLEQNAKLGASGFLSTLQQESRDALQDRKSHARQRGEEAGTKLLLPMILMLAIVMVVIIVPAFVSI